MTDGPADADNLPRLAIVAPTFNNVATLLRVLLAVEPMAEHVFAVDDGSTDGTAALLGEWASESPMRRTVVTHSANRGKADALRSGFGVARSRGFTHALTIDTDGQHDPDDVPSLLALARADPRAIVVGVRPLATPGYPLRSRVGRRLSNALVAAVGGVRVEDSQSGLRVYPLAIADALDVRTERYAFETEILARAGWANVRVLETPIRCIYHAPAERVSHFRPWGDSLSAVAMHARLLVRSLGPSPIERVEPTRDDTATGTIAERALRAFNVARLLRRARAEPRERHRVAASVGIGLFVGCQPPFGYKTLACLALAKLFRLPVVTLIGASSLTTPPVGPFVWLASIVLGHALLHGEWLDASGVRDQLREPARLLRTLVGEWLLGASAVGAIAGVAGWLATRWAVAPPSSRRAGVEAS